MSRSLEGKLAVVTGASRGIGKGIALELGAAGATVYLTGRSVATGALPGTISETAEQVTANGGTGIGLACDHHDDEQVAQLFDRVGNDHGRLDLLVNNVYSSPDLAPWLGKTFWELPIDAWDQVIDIGLRSHYVASVLAAPLLFASSGSLIVNVSSSGAVEYAHNVVYGVGKAALDRMTADMALELRSRSVAVVSVWPGLVKTELVMSGATQGPGGRLELQLPGEGTFDLSGAESPHFTGRAVAALASDAGILSRSGQAISVNELAQAYGFTDIDGSVPGVRLRHSG